MGEPGSNVDGSILELRCLLENFRKCLKFWFLANQSKALVEFINACTEIMMHGLHLDLQNTEEKHVALGKFMDEFEWVRKSALIKDFDFVECAEENLSIADEKPTITLQNFLHKWVLQNLQDKTMCASIETIIITEKELLQLHYQKSAFLKHESYAHAFIIGLSAFELNQYSLLSQIDKSLYTNSISITKKGDKLDGVKSVKHKRTSSHPNFSLSPVRATVQLKSNEIVKSELLLKKEIVPNQKTVLPAFRKTKSLPTISTTNPESLQCNQNFVRPRSKTLHSFRHRSSPKPIPITCNFYNKIENSIPTSIKSQNRTATTTTTDDQPSTSFNSCNSQLSSSTTSSTATTKSSISSSSSPSNVKKSQEAAIPQRIQLINCDDIKIWTDQSCTPEHKLKTTNLEPPHTLASPVTIKKPTKNVSPTNSFLTSLFGTPPTLYSTWYTADIQTEQATAAVLCSGSAIENHNSSSFYNGSVFDAFIPVYGQKMQSRKKSKLFEDDMSKLDFKPTIETTSPGKTGLKDKTNDSLQRTPASCQSLTAFLQMSQVSRTDTELEKENAHFRISEAIISAIEHIKWAKTQRYATSKDSTVAELASDWLKSGTKNMEEDARISSNSEEETILTDASECIPFVEHSESCLESLSAETVGLSLISKFNEKHMPKVSELKWLVSDEDTPQQLLPLPNSNSSGNLDENVLLPMTRGTKYWAPPRPQIIFTEHPAPERRALIRKQNNRCSGCGMRVSTQNISSFRYCTYFGKYHCTGCHRNQMATTPAKILQNWDFKCYPVSVFAYRLLEQLYTYPLFHVPDLNAALYVRSKSLLEARNKRLQLKCVRNFIKACRYAERERNYFETIPDHITYDIDTWSMSDFFESRNESMQRSINELIEKCENHIFHCVLCTGRGYCCEFCHRDRVIYPWQSKVFRCDRCGSCFHLNCWREMLEICCRCQRIWNRQNEVAESLSEK